MNTVQKAESSTTLEQILTAKININMKNKHRFGIYEKKDSCNIEKNMWLINIFL